MGQSTLNAFNYLFAVPLKALGDIKACPNIFITISIILLPKQNIGHECNEEQPLAIPLTFLT